MEVAIYGAGKFGQYVWDCIHLEKSKIFCNIVIDNGSQIKRKNKADVKIVNINEFFSTYLKNIDAILIVAINVIHRQEMVISLLKRNYKKIYIIPEEVFYGQLPVLDKNGELASYINIYDKTLPVLSYLEYHVSDYCNLKCKGCGHFSNLVIEKKFPDIEEFKNMLKGLEKKFRNIEVFRLMGGEPLINPEWTEFIYVIKQIFPYTDIRIATNGLLVTEMKSKEINALRECNAIIDISQYPPTRKNIEKILEFVKQNRIKINIASEITKFFKQYNFSKKSNYEKTYWGCISKKCHFLRNGRIYPCPALKLCFENKEFLGIDLEISLIESNSFDIISGKESGWEILEKIENPFEFCKYCSTELVWFDWQISDKEIKKEDWII